MQGGLSVPTPSTPLPLASCPDASAGRLPVPPTSSSFMFITAVLRERTINIGFPRGWILKQTFTISDDENDDHDESNRIIWGYYFVFVRAEFSPVPF